MTMSRPNQASMIDAEEVMRLEDLCVEFDGQRVVDGLSLEVRAGETVALVGESGSGKSITALAALGLLPREAKVGGGRWLAGQRLDDLAVRDWRRLRGGEVGMIFQEPMSSLNPLHTVGRQIGETLKLHQGLDAGARRQRVLELLRLVRLPRVERLIDAYPHALSGGQRQRVMIAMAIANDPKLLIADEPTTALDVTIAREVLALIEDLRERLGMGVLLITHDLNLVRRHAQRVCVLCRGRTEDYGDTERVFEAPGSSYTRALIDAEPDGRPIPLETDAEPLLDARGLSVEYRANRRLFARQAPAFTALSPIDVTLARGETLGIVGESGSGKSTLALALARLVPSSGEILFAGERLDLLQDAALRRRRRDIAMVFQDPYGSLSPRMSVTDIISEGLRFHHPELTREQVDDRVMTTLDAVELDRGIAGRYPHEFSGGQRARIALARSLILEPKLLILDEPTSALDRQVQKRLIVLLRRLQAERGLSYLFISHDLAVVRAVAHRILVLKEGRLIECRECQALIDSPNSDYTRGLIEASLLKPSVQQP